MPPLQNWKFLNFQTKIILTSPGQLTQRKFARWPISAPQSPQSVGVSEAMSHCVTEPANFFVFWSKSAPWWRHALDKRAKNREIYANIYQRTPKNPHPSRSFLSVKKPFQKLFPKNHKVFDEITNSLINVFFYFEAEIFINF